jgi:endopeptidase La
MKDDYLKFALKKVEQYKKIITRTLSILKYYNSMDIITNATMNEYVEIIQGVYQKVETAHNHWDTKKGMIDCMKELNNDIIDVFKHVGTKKLKDVLYIVIGSDFSKYMDLNKTKKQKFDLLLQYMKPYKISVYKKSDLHRKSFHVDAELDDNDIICMSGNINCYEMSESESFITRVYGVRLVLHVDNVTVLVHGLVDDMLLSCIDSPYVSFFMDKFKKNHPPEDNFKNIMFIEYTKSLTLKHILVSQEKTLYHGYLKMKYKIHQIKERTISNTIREFLNISLYEQRYILLALLMDESSMDSKYMAYLLYDLLSNDSNEVVDTMEQKLLSNSFSWYMKKKFKTSMKHTLDYTKKLSTDDNNKVPLEQQICLMKAPVNVKEKAIIKLKEIKSKSEDSGSKARQYLEGMLKIPFEIYRKETILNIVPSIKTKYLNIRDQLEKYNIPLENEQCESAFQMISYINKINIAFNDVLLSEQFETIISVLHSGKRKQLVERIKQLNQVFESHDMKVKISHSGKNISELQECIREMLHACILKKPEIMNDIYMMLDIHCSYVSLIDYTKQMNDLWKQIQDTMVVNKKCLDKAVHGHENAKRSLERIIGQWINGDSSGYCLGFEGPPGVGKTSLATKGLAKCLKDEDGVSRPFSFVAVGGSSNGSTLEGHNYTYVGSTWGRIVDILIESKCMNPIIFIDELDKISKTEHGKEIIGILTHMVDPTQNDSFQDKYFNGINIDLSKVLFIFSYNDVSCIDRILLDRIHRIKFDSLSEDEKVIITRNYLLPEIFKKTGLHEKMIECNDDIIRYIISKYTYESGVRKLKEILFDIFSEINLECFNNTETNLPIVLTETTISEHYLKKRHIIRNTEIGDKPIIGEICGLWANAYGLGGILPIQTKWFPTNNFMDLKLTGKQGDVMQESMIVAKTIASNLTDHTYLKTLYKTKKEESCKGIHIHCPEGAVPKDGPSAGAAITTCIYSLLNNKPIKHDLAITGEINLKGEVTAIGGLEYKIEGGIKAGVKTFLYPTQNHKDYTLIIEKKPYIAEAATFIEVSHIEDVFQHVFA